MTDYEEVHRQAVEAFPDTYRLGFDECLLNRTAQWAIDNHRQYGVLLMVTASLWFRASQEPLRVEHYFRGLFMGHLNMAIMFRRPETIFQHMLASSYGMRTWNIFNFLAIERDVWEDVCAQYHGNAPQLRRLLQLIEDFVEEWEQERG